MPDRHVDAPAHLMDQAAALVVSRLDPADAALAERFARLFFARVPPADLAEAGAEDMARAEDLQPLHADEHAAVYVLPDAAWSRRVNGVFGNRLAQAAPARAHAVLVTRGDGYVVSVRAPRAHPRGAETLCTAFGETETEMVLGAVNRFRG